MRRFQLARRGHTSTNGRRGSTRNRRIPPVFWLLAAAFAAVLFALPALGGAFRSGALSAAAANPAADLDQCRNGAAASPVDCDHPGGNDGWVNGNAGQSNSHYIEGYSIPYRLRMTDLPVGNPITVTLKYNIRHSGKTAIDFLTETSSDRLEPHLGFGHDAEAIEPTADIPGMGNPVTRLSRSPRTCRPLLPLARRSLLMTAGTR